MIIHVNKMFLLLILVLFVGACGIDRGGIVDTPQPTPPGTQPIPGGSVSGKITAIDLDNSTLVINELSLDVSNSLILVNGTTQDLSTLNTGTLATSFANSGTSFDTPNEIRIDLNTTGGGVLFDPTELMFDQFGQQIVFENLVSNSDDPMLPRAGLQSLAVSGYTATDGTVDATSIVMYDSSQPFFVTGFVDQIDPFGFTFQIGLQLFDYSRAISINTPNGSVNPLDRLRVQLAPNNSTNPDALNVLTIDAAPLIDPQLGENAFISITGYVTAELSNNTFEIAFVTLILTDTTELSDLVAEDINIDTLITAEGVLTADGAVQVQTLRISSE